MLPGYISKAVPNPSSNRAPVVHEHCATYGGIFLWIVFYREIGSGTLERAGVGLCLLALLIGGLLSYALFYRVPAMLGMQTGYPLYVVGSSTFGTQGGYLMPGILMGLLQVGWMSVNAFVATTFILTAFGSKAGPGTLPFGLIAAAWALGLGYVGAKGIQYVSKFALYLNFVPLLMILIVFAKNAGGISGYVPPQPSPLLGFTMLIQIVVGFFATAGAAGVDFGMNSRDERDVRWGGLVRHSARGADCRWIAADGCGGRPRALRRSRFPLRFGDCANRELRRDRLLSVRRSLHCTDVLLVLYCWKQPGNYDSGGAALDLHDGRGSGCGDSRHYGSRGKPGKSVYHHRRVVRPDLWRNGCRLLVVRQEVVRPKRGR